MKPLMINSKSEALNPKQYQITKIPMLKFRIFIYLICIFDF